jgi:polyisoprenoid-binding protein YceI
MSTTTPSTPTRLLDDAVLPAAGTWDIDPVHADVAFTGRHFMVTKVRGRFTDISGAVVVGEDMNDSRVDVVIAMASVESGSVVRDDHLRSPEMFDVEQFPQATFRSVSVDWRGTRGVVQGDLTLHGVTRRVPLEVTFGGHVRDPWGGDRAIFSATTRVNREDFGITWNVALEAGGVLVSKEVTIDIQVETVLRGADHAG